MPLNKLYDLAENENIQIELMRLPNIKSASAMIDRDCYIAIDPFELESETDEVIKLSHEIAHCMTGSFYNPYSNCDLKSRHEYRANKWQVHALLPFEQYERALKKGYVEFWELAEYLELPEDFIRMADNIYKREGLLNGFA